MLKAFAHQSGVALSITRELIHRKLLGQEQVTREHLKNSYVGSTISNLRLEIGEAESIDAVRLIESQAARAYWSAWRDLQVNFPTKVLARVPEHWRSFGTRFSPLTGNPRLAVNPANAMLNYLYGILESESRLAAATLGLDPGMGVLHADASRDSLACDLMEPVRPQVDAYVLNWIQTRTLAREWFFEQKDGNCRLMTGFAARLSETASSWQRAVAPIAEFAAQSFWKTAKAWNCDRPLPTNLTQSRRRESSGSPAPAPTHQPHAPRLCRGCGKELKKKTSLCGDCGRSTARENMLIASQKGRVLSHTEQAHSRISATQKRHAAARLAWNPAEKPAWLTRGVYLSEIQSRLSSFSASEIAMAIQTSLPYATKLRKAIRVPHPMHWGCLAKLVGVDEPR